jgi:hypothetical protein
MHYLAVPKSQPFEKGRAARRYEFFEVDTLKCDFLSIFGEVFSVKYEILSRDGRISELQIFINFSVPLLVLAPLRRDAPFLVFLVHFAPPFLTFCRRSQDITIRHAGIVKLLRPYLPAFRALRCPRRECSIGAWRQGQYRAAGQRGHDSQRENSVRHRSKAELHFCAR